MNALKPSTSTLFSELLNDLPEDNVKIGVLVTRLKRRSYGGIFVLLALLALLPGISVIAGLAILIPAWQLLARYPAPVLPKFVSEIEIDSAAVITGGEKLVSLIVRIERYVRPRWSNFTTPTVYSIAAVIIACLAFVIVLPLPFSNFLPAVALLLFSFGMLESDGLLVFVAMCVAVVALVVGISVLSIALALLAQI